MAPITTIVDVARPQREVFEYVTDPTRFIEWQHGVVKGEMDGHGPHGVGARCLTTRRIGFAERPVTSEITHIDPPRTWGVRALDGCSFGTGRRGADRQLCVCLPNLA
jgi:hypothetical protein